MGRQIPPRKGAVRAAGAVEIERKTGLSVVAHRSDHREIAECMAIIGMTREKVNVDALARDIETFQDRLVNVDPTTLIQGDRNDREVNRLLFDLINIGEKHGIRFPREFALLLKQFLYFDRYVQALAPELDVFGDGRVDIWSGLDEGDLPKGLLHLRHRERCVD